MRLSKKLFQQMDKVECVVLIATLLFVIPFSSQKIFGDFWDKPIIQTIEIVGWMIAVPMSFIFGIRGARLNGFIGKTNSYLFNGSILSILLIGINIAILFMIPKALDLYKAKDEKILELKSMLEATNLDVRRKAFLSSYIASEQYQQNRKLLDVYDKDGVISKYIPTKTDKEIIEGRTRLERYIREIKKSTFIFISVLIISILVGTLTPIKKKRYRPAICYWLALF